MEDKILRTINKICLNFSTFPPGPPSNVVVFAPLYSLPCPKSVHPNTVWSGEGRASRGIQVVREMHIMLHLNI